MLEHERAEAVFPDRALYLPTFSHFLIVNKASLSFSSTLLSERRYGAPTPSSWGTVHGDPTPTSPS